MSKTDKIMMGIVLLCIGIGLFQIKRTPTTEESTLPPKKTAEENRLNASSQTPLQQGWDKWLKSDMTSLAQEHHSVSLTNSQNLRDPSISTAQKRQTARENYTQRDRSKPTRLPDDYDNFAYIEALKKELIYNENKDPDFAISEEEAWKIIEEARYHH